MTKAYYGPDNTSSDSYRLSPAPQITMRTEPYYSGGIIIGYTHVISLRGYAAAYRKTGTTEPSNSISSIGLVTANISLVKNILSRNGSFLSVKEDDGAQTIKCKGGTLRSLSFNESPNNWMGYSEYSAEIEFNEIELVNGTIACSDSYLDADSKSNSIVDIAKYKIKAFTDSWSFNIEDDIYNRVLTTDVGNMDTDNSRISVSYTISATGQNYYVGNNLVPAWQQAKNFAQNKLYQKISNMLSTSLGLTANTACDASSSLAAIGSSTDSALSNLNTGYRVYNETVSCNTSESEGSFSATYNAIIKRNKSSSTNHPASIHTFNKSISIQNESRKTTTISIQGNIEGLVEGGIIRAAGTGFTLPQSGSIFISGTANSKYSQALTALGKIIVGTDLTPATKALLGINTTALGLTAEQLEECETSTIKPSSFNLTHNYHEGTIGYSIEYNSNMICGSGSYANISISVDNPLPILAEIVIPHSGVLIIQDINTYTAKKININIEGKGSKECCLDADSLAAKIGGNAMVLPPDLTLPDPETYILTQKQRTDNPIDGSYSISLSYICQAGCL
jgi:hypothetical protein